MKLGENIRALREQFSFSQETLAEKVFVSRQTISNWENNKSYPDLHSDTYLSLNQRIDCSDFFDLAKLCEGSIAVPMLTEQSKDKSEKVRKIKLI